MTSLKSRWEFLCVKIGKSHLSWEEIADAYSEKTRAYHNLGHIKHCLEEFDQVKHLANDPTSVELAIWFHDIDPNEGFSADIASAFLKGTVFGERVSSLIFATQHKTPQTGDAALICDIDLSILGQDPKTYKAYTTAVRKEYPDITDKDFAEGRTSVLQRFLDREKIFSTEHFQEKYEAAAKENLSQEIERLAKAQYEGKTPCIGLFGTCGKSTWRNEFIEHYQELGIEFFNPQVSDWKPELADIEAQHLATDEIILFPVTNETYAAGSLSEVGFSILNAIKMDNRRDFVVMIDKTLEPELMGNEAAAKDSLRSRALVSAHLKNTHIDNLYVVDSLEDMLAASVQLYRAAKIKANLKQYKPQP